MEHEDWYVPGYGTEKVGPFLKSLCEMARPERILEIGMGYTTPFLLEALKNNTNNLLWDSNCDKEYLNKPYNPKFVVIDDQSLENNDDRAKKRRVMLKDEPLVEFIEGDFSTSSVMNDVMKHAPYDLVWFDCGGPAEYQFFVDEYWGMVKEYALFHFTYFRGEPNRNHDILSKISETVLFRMDIVEPHKFKQGSISMLKKSPRPSFEQILSGSLLNE